MSLRWSFYPLKASSGLRLSPRAPHTITFSIKGVALIYEVLRMGVEAKLNPALTTSVQGLGFN